MTPRRKRASPLGLANRLSDHDADVSTAYACLELLVRGDHGAAWITAMRQMAGPPEARPRSPGDLGIVVAAGRPAKYGGGYADVYVADEPVRPES